MKTPILILLALTPCLLWAEPPAFKKDLAAFHKKPGDWGLREKVIQDALSMKPAPTLPGGVVRLREEARKASEKSQFQDAVQSFKKASDLAPWDAGTYSDLAQAQQKAGLYPEAVQSLNLYLLAAPGAGDRQQVQDQIKKLGDLNQHWMADQIEHLDDESVGNSLSARFTEMGPASKTEVPFLVKALKNNDTDTRSHAAMVLGQMGPQAAEAIPALAQRLDDPQTIVRESAADALSKLGPDVAQVLPDLMDALKDDDPNVRVDASLALGNMGPSAVKAVPALIKILKDSDPKVRQNSAYALGKIGPPAKDALPALGGLSDGGKSVVKKNAAWAVQQINGAAE